MNEQITIGKNSFVVVALPAYDSFLLQPRIAPAVAEVLGTAATLISTLPDGTEELRLADIDVDQLIPVIGKFFAKMPPDELGSIMRKLLAGATMDGALLFSVNGDPAAFNIVMKGRTVDTWRLLWHAVRLNYPDFFGGLGAIGRAGAAGAPSVASST